MNIATATTTVGLNKPPELEVVNMTKRFGTMTALDHVSMTLKPGTFHALLGENGAGKSTFVKCVMGFYSWTKAEARNSQTALSPESHLDFG